MRSALTLLLLLLLLLLPAPAAALPDDLPFQPEAGERWVLIDTDDYVLTVYSGRKAKARFTNLAVGRGGTAEARRSGDNTTPLGQFRISRINPESRYHLFLGLNYPTLDYANRARRRGVIDDEEYYAFLDRFARLGRPPQGTALGGHIGIHGVGSASLRFHRHVNWTEGCIALEDDQIEALAELVDVGTRVLIR